MQESLVQEILEKLKSAQLVVLVLHRGPDADSLGAAAAFAQFLRAQGIAFRFYCESELPSSASFFGIDIKGTVPIRGQSPDIICTFDAGDLAHAGLSNWFKAELFPSQSSALDQKPFIINFDHHATNTLFGNLNVIDTSCASTTELIYNFFQAIRFPINTRAASYLLAGVLNDTDHFLNPATTSSSLQMASELISRGVSLSAIRELLFEQRGINALRLIGEVLSRLRKNPRYGIAVTYVTNEDVKRYNMNFDEIADIANILNAIGDCSAMAVLKCEDGLIRCSMRTTRNDINLSRLAELLGGGGHKKAAGFRVRGTLTQAGQGVRIK